MTMPDLSGEQVLITQPDALMGPTLCAVFAELGAQAPGTFEEHQDRAWKRPAHACARGTPL